MSKPLTKAELKAVKKREDAKRKRTAAIEKKHRDIAREETKEADARALEQTRILEEERAAVILLTKTVVTKAAAEVRLQKTIDEAFKILNAFDDKPLNQVSFAYLMQINPEIRAKLTTLLMCWNRICPNVDPLMIEDMLIANAHLYIENLYTKDYSHAVVSIVHAFPALDTRSEYSINKGTSFFILNASCGAMSCTHREATEAINAGAMHFGDPFPFFDYAASDEEAMREVIQNFGEFYVSH